MRLSVCSVLPASPVPDVREVARRVEGSEVVVHMRKTLYGASEIFVRAPCAAGVGFAEFAAQP